MKKEKITHAISYALVAAGMYYIIDILWRELEIGLYGFSQESAIDTIAAIILTFVVVNILDS